MKLANIKQHNTTLTIFTIFGLGLIISVIFNNFYMSGARCQEFLLDNYHQKDIKMYLFETRDARYPLMTFLLFLLFHIFNGSFFWVRFFMSCLGAVSCVLTYLIAKKVTNRKAATLAGIIAAVYPNLFFWSAFFLAETLLTTLFLTAIYLIIKFQDQMPAKKLVLIGLFLGLAALAKGVMLFFFPLLLFWIIHFYWNDKKIMTRSIFCIFVTAAVVITPWTVRNYILLGKFVPIAANGGRSFYGANNPLSLEKDVRGLGLWDGNSVSNLLLETKGMSIVETDRYCYNKAMEWIISTLKNKPAEFFKLELWKLQKAYFPKILDRDSNSKKLFYFIYFCVTVFGIIGIALSLPEKRKYSLFYYILLTHLIITLIFFGEVRLRTSFDPILIIFSSLTVIALCKKIEKYIKTT